MKSKQNKKKSPIQGMGMEGMLGNGTMLLDGPMASESTGAFQRMPGAGMMGGMSMNEQGAKEMASKKKQKTKGLKR